MKNKLKTTILMVSLLQMGSFFMGSIIGNLVEEFPNYSASACQLVMTVPNLVVIFVSILCGKLDSVVSKRTFILTACSAILVGGIGLCLLHTNLYVMYLFSAIFGMGQGIILSVTATMIAIYFDESEQGSVYGIQNTVTNIGGMILSISAGYLCKIKWYYAFLAVLIIIPGLILSMKNIPNEKGAKKETTTKVSMPSNVYLYMVIILVFLLMFNVLPTNIALFLKETSLGDSSVSGMVSAFLLVGGAVSGLFFKKLTQMMGQKTITLGFVNLAIGYFLIAHASNLLMVFAGAFFAGCTLSLLMSQLSLNISTTTSAFVAPVALAYVISSNNLGGFLSPLVFGLLPQQSLSEKFTIISIISFVVAICTLFVLKDTKKSA